MSDDKGTDIKMAEVPGVKTVAKPKSGLAADDQLIHIKVYSPFKVYFDGDAYSISAMNDTGPFDVLAHHHNFITLLSSCDLMIRTPRGEEKIRISHGLMHVKSGRVAVFLDV